MTKNKKTIIALIALAALIAAAVLAWHFWGPQNGVQTGAKSITVTVVHGDGSSKEIEFRTDAEYLGDALTEQKLVEGDEGEFGLFIRSVDGETADISRDQWWNITKGGEMLMTGADMTPIQDGDAFELTLTVGYDVF